MKKRITKKKQQQCKQCEQEQLQAAWDLISKKLDEQKEAHCFFVDRKWVSSSAWQYRIHNLDGFEMKSTQRLEVHK